MDVSRLRGSIVPIITPFDDGGQIDEGTLERLIDWQIASGSHGISVTGTTGEPSALSLDERRRMLDLGKAAVAGRVPFVPATGTNNIDETTDLTKYAERLGVDAALVIVPYYNRPSQEGLFRYFRAVAERVDLPIIIYNIPGRSIVDMSVDTMKRLNELKNIAGVKDATANMARVSQQRAALGEDFNQMSGEDITALGFMAHGGHGCISVTSNVAPRLCSEFQNACLKGDYATALKLQDKLAPLHINLFVETSPAPIKYALSLIGKCANTVRLPMVPATEKAQAAVREAMVHAGLLN